MKFDTGMAFHALFRAHHNAAHARLSEAGMGDLGSPRLLVTLLRCVEKGQKPSQRELADLLHVSPATIATSMKSLERNGYVERHTDPKDSRRNVVTITDKARESLEAGGRIFAQVDEAMLTGFTQEEIEQLSAYHARMLENLYAIGGDQDAPPCNKSV